MKSEPAFPPAGFRLEAPFEPRGDQPAAIAALTRGLRESKKHQVLLGVTGSGKTFTIAQVIQDAQRPTLVLAPNKTLAAQLFTEFREFFPHNAVEYFISYYDYYQPEAYVPSSDTYIAKDSSINDRIEAMRHAATHSLMTRRDVIIVASVSCIYGLGSPDTYEGLKVTLQRGQEMDRDHLLRALVQIQYARNDLSPARATFRARGDVVEIRPAYDDKRILRVEFFGDEIEALDLVDALTGEVLSELEETTIFPSSHYVTPEDRLKVALRSIREELVERLDQLREAKKLIEAQRLEMRTRSDLELLEEMGMCPGIENYSRHLDGRGPGEPPPVLLDYFDEDWLLVIDESHLALPQVNGMLRGDVARKSTLVEHGFRLPSALDNRPLSFEEFDRHLVQAIYVSATPAELEVERSGGVSAEQVIRPTGLLDPVVEVRPARGQVEDLVGEARDVVARGFRVLVTCLTKRLAEDLTTYMRDLDFEVRYLHSDIDSIERSAILRSLRLKEFDVLVGINLLREGLDLPEVALVAVLDADKEGFLRSRGSLIQTIGRAARNAEGRTILYGDTVTESMRQAIEETNRRRERQLAYNTEHGLEPKTIIKPVADSLEAFYERDYVEVASVAKDAPAEEEERPEDLEATIATLREEMFAAAQEQRYEQAAALRDRIESLQQRFLEGS